MMKTILFCVVVVTLLWIGTVLCAPPPGERPAKTRRFNLLGEPTFRARTKRSGSHCPRICHEVCGANERVYCNFCHAHCLGVDVVHNETCGKWWELDEDDCANCHNQYHPVCACDRTYYNSCVAECMDIPNYMITRGACGA